MRQHHKVRCRHQNRVNVWLTIKDIKAGSFDNLFSKAFASATSSTTSPLAVFIKTNSGLACAKFDALIKCRFEAPPGQCSETKSLSLKRVSTELNCSALYLFNSSALTLIGKNILFSYQIQSDHVKPWLGQCDQSQLFLVSYQ